MSQLDAIDRQILQLLQTNDQASLGELGKAVGLVPSSVKERIKRLTEQGVITGFHARVAPDTVGLDLLAFMFVGWGDSETEAPFLKRMMREPAVLECHHVTGAWNYLMKVRLRNTGQLERFLADVIKTVPGVQRTETLIVLSSAKETTMLAVDPPGSPVAKPTAGPTRKRRSGPRRQSRTP
jgi:Lrp/AsnC family leucine-responsive transcriptional regulator